MDEGAKEKLEQELRFLKESFDAEVISKEEYEKGKERIEKKLQGNENKGNNNESPESQEPDKKEAEMQAESKSQIKSEETAEAKKYVEPQQSEAKEQKKEGRKGNNYFRYAVVFVVLTLIVFFGYSLLNQNRGTAKEEIKAVQFTPICSLDKDCIQSGRQGACLEPGTKDAKCQYPEIKKAKATVLNDRKNCFNCGTERVLAILESWFGSLDVSEIDYSTPPGKEIADKFNLTALPAYIFDSDIASKAAYNKVKQAFVMKNGNYLLGDNAAASTFYFRRENIPNKLDFFAKEQDATSIKAEKNLKEFLGAFPDIKFERHSSGSAFAKEIGIRTFPAFLVNNVVKFSGLQTAETIKDNFCSMNKLEECKKELPNNLIQ